MKILIVHNEYAKYSGEEAVVDKMEAMLTAHGHSVARLSMSTASSRDSLGGKIHGFAAGIYSPRGVRAMRDALRKEQPDVVNVHNLYPFISPAALFECRRAGIPVVMTIHNFRLVCPTGLFMREQPLSDSDSNRVPAPCELCLERGNEWGCIRFNCEHSLLKSVGYAARNAVARLTGAFRKCVTRYACITAFQRGKLMDAGFDPERITVIPNSVELPEETPTTPGDYVAFCGRISREKGVDMIMEVARRHPEIEFRLAGAVRDEDIVADMPENVRLTGYLSGDALSDFYRGARFFVMASRWYEGFPMSILEAAQHARAMVGPDHGGFTEIIGEESTDNGSNIGLLFRPGDTDDLERQTVRMWQDRTLATELGLRARKKLAEEYATEPVYRKWERLLTDLVKKRPLR